MKIAVLGAGAMGGLFGAYLSQSNQVTLLDVNQELVDTINKQGLQVLEPDGTSKTYHPLASTKAPEEPVDLVVVFVKAMYTKAALTANQSMIGENTYLLSLQNGSGHEGVLQQFVDARHVIIGTTQHNASAPQAGVCRHGGSGLTYFGSTTGDISHLQPFATAFTACGLQAQVSHQVQKMVWNKMFTNISASVLTGVLQVPLGYIAQNQFAWQLCTTLIQEAVDVAAKMGMNFNYEEKVTEVKAVCLASPQGLTSIYADLKNGRKTEVDTISGSIVQAGKQWGVPTPSHQFVVSLVHALEGR